MSAALTLPIQIGKKYARRDGVVVTALVAKDGVTKDTVYVGVAGEAENNMHADHAWKSTGRIHRQGGETPQDLVADHVEEEVSAPQTHPHAEILRLIADGKPVQWQDSAGTWLDQAATVTLKEIATGDYGPGRYRETPPEPVTIRIGEFDVPQPLQRAPAHRSRYWTPCLGVVDPVDSYYWTDDLVDLRFLARGLAHATREAALLHAEALLSLTTIETQ